MMCLSRHCGTYGMCRSLVQQHYLKSDGPLHFRLVSAALREIEPAAGYPTSAPLFTLGLTWGAQGAAVERKARSSRASSLLETFAPPNASWHAPATSPTSTGSANSADA